MDVRSSSYVTWNISYSKTFSCGKQLQVHMNKIFHKNKLAIPGPEWLVLSRRGNTTQISDAAWVARDANTHECVVTLGGHAPTHSSGGQGHPGAGALGSVVRAEEGWVLGGGEKPKPRWAWQPCQWLSALLCSWPKSIALPWSPSYSVSWSNSISCHQKWHKKQPKIPFITWGFWD